MIGRLVHNNSAYAAEGHVLFDTQAFSDYGKLSGRPLDEMIAGARVEVAPYKQHPADFVLWKPSKPGEPEWESPWGAGRPGWHIECSAMIEQELGLPIDIHGGGIDLVFPHHENELAQGVCDGHHARDLRQLLAAQRLPQHGRGEDVQEPGQCALAHDLLKQQPGEVIRWALLGAHYRQPLSWTEDALSQARNSLDHLYGVLGRARAHRGRRQRGAAGRPAGAPAGRPQHARRHVHAQEARQPTSTPRCRTAAATAPAIKQDLLALAEVMGFLRPDPQDLVPGRRRRRPEDPDRRPDRRPRRRARSPRTGREADRIRAELTALNVEVMDGPAGATWRTKGAGLMPVPPPLNLKAGPFGTQRLGDPPRPEADEDGPAAAQAAEGPADRAPRRHPGAGRGDLGGDLRPRRPGTSGTRSTRRPRARSASARCWR